MNREMENKEKVKAKNTNKKPAAAKKKSGSISQNAIRKALTIAVTIFSLVLIISIALIFVVSKKIESLAGADAQIKLSAQGPLPKPVCRWRRPYTIL